MIQGRGRTRSRGVAGGTQGQMVTAKSAVVSSPLIKPAVGRGRGRRITIVVAVRTATFSGKLSCTTPFVGRQPTTRR